jgi:hypothetical protein
MLRIPHRLRQKADATHLRGMEAVTRLAQHDASDLIASAATGDEYAFRSIIAAHHEDMRRVCVHVTGDRAVADGPRWIRAPS